VFKHLSNLLGTFHLDLFATFQNHLCPLYVSPFPDEMAFSVDALSMSWSSLPLSYAFPPTILLRKVLAKVLAEQARIFLLAPLWPRQSWFAEILELSVSHAIRLPLDEDLLQQGRFLHSNPSILQLHGWIISGKPWPDKDFQKTLPRSLKLRHASPQVLSMIRSGDITEVGVSRGVSILSVPLNLIF
jgi:hypothetical protein